MVLRHELFIETLMASSKLGNVCLILMLITNFVSCFDSFYEKNSRKHELLSVHGLWQGSSGKSLRLVPSRRYEIKDK